jgi:hypothetical protein
VRADLVAMADPRDAAPDARSGRTAAPSIGVAQLAALVELPAPPAARCRGLDQRGGVPPPSWKLQLDLSYFRTTVVEQSSERQIDLPTAAIGDNVLPKVPGGFSANELNAFRKIIVDNLDRILETWNEHCGE